MEPKIYLKKSGKCWLDEHYTTVYDSKPENAWYMLCMHIRQYKCTTTQMLRLYSLLPEKNAILLICNAALNKSSSGWTFVLVCCPNNDLGFKMQVDPVQCILGVGSISAQLLTAKICCMGHVIYQCGIIT